MRNNAAYEKIRPLKNNEINANVKMTELYIYVTITIIANNTKKESFMPQLLGRDIIPIFFKGTSKGKN